MIKKRKKSMSNLDFNSFSELKSHGHGFQVFKSAKSLVEHLNNDPDQILQKIEPPIFSKKSQKNSF